MAAKCNEDTNMVIKHHNMVRSKIEEQVDRLHGGGAALPRRGQGGVRQDPDQSLLIDDARRTLHQTLERIHSGQPKVEISRCARR